MAHILYFTKGLPSASERSEADRLGAVIRNATFVCSGDALERCDAVAGPHIPPSYASAFPPAGKKSTSTGGRKKSAAPKNSAGEANG